MSRELTRNYYDPRLEDHYHHDYIEEDDSTPDLVDEKKASEDASYSSYFSCRLKKKLVKKDHEHDTRDSPSITAAHNVHTRREDTQEKDIPLDIRIGSDRWAYIYIFDAMPDVHVPRKCAWIL